MLIKQNKSYNSLLKELENKMAGHSKWANIKHRKAAADAKKGKITTRLVKEITIAAKIGGGDANANPRLRLAMEKARDNNVPKDNVERAIKRGTSSLDGVNYEEIRFEGYGIGGAGVIVDCLTDNKTRTVADVRHAFNKHGGNLGTDGCVSFQFQHCGQIIVVLNENSNLSNEIITHKLDELMNVAIDLNAIDVVINEDNSLEILTNPADFLEFKNAITTNLALNFVDFTLEFAEIIMRPDTEITLLGEDARKMQNLLDAFDDLDDVQVVYTTAVLEI